MTKFRPCIDLHNGKVKQIIGGSLKLDNSDPDTNFISDYDSKYYSGLFKKDKLAGGHVIMLGKGNEQAALLALESYPNHLQVGGGINVENGKKFLDAGASHLIITSYLFDKNGNFLKDNLIKMSNVFSSKRIVIDLSCKRSCLKKDDIKKSAEWSVYMNLWNTKTNLALTEKNILEISKFCDEFLIHSLSYEGLQEGFDKELIYYLSKLSHKLKIKITYAGGIKSINELYVIDEISNGRLDVTIGSALDIFGGRLVKYKDCVNFNRRVN